MSPQSRRALPIWRRVVIAIVIFYAIRYFIGEVDEHYAVDEWMLWHYGRYWLWCGVFSLGCFATGEVIVRALVGRLRGLYLHTFASFCVGVFTFGIGMFVAGLAGLYGPMLFYLLPLGMVAVGARRIWHYKFVLGPRLRRLAPAKHRGLWAILIMLLGVYGFLLLYTGVLSPDNAMVDARWKHLALAETYAAHGGVMRFPQGWLFSTRPHFASWLYTWAFLIPDGVLFDRIELAAHLEFTLFLWTTVLGIPAMVRWLVPGADPKLVWVARFLFPGTLLYDSNLSIGADHISATFVVAIVMLTHEAVRKRFHLGYCALLGLMLAAITLTKETACLMLLPVAVAWVAVAMIRQAIWRRPGDGKLRWLLGPLLISVIAIAATAPFWLTNWVWHGDPLYPNLHRFVKPHPWSADSAYLYEWGYKKFQFGFFTQGERGRLIETLHVLYNWSFDPHDWPGMHGDRPVIGSLVTLLLPVVLLLRGTKRLWIVALWIHVGIVVWFNLLPQDRYLQALMPMMAAFVAAAIVLAWRQRVRALLVALIALQVVWGADAYFLFRNQLGRVVKIFAASHKGDLQTRLRTQGGWNEVGEAVPEDARLLVHEIHPHLGSGRVTIPDFQTWQFGLSYGLMASPRQVWDAYKKMGITHIFWRGSRSRAWDSLAGDIMFFTFVTQHVEGTKRIGKNYVAKVPDTPPTGEYGFGDVVAVYTCSGHQFRRGQYRVRDLHVVSFGPMRLRYPKPRVQVSPKDTIEDMVARANYVVVEPRCREPVAGLLDDEHFLRITRRERMKELKNRGYEIWMRRGAPGPIGDEAATEDEAPSEPE